MQAFQPVQQWFAQLSRAGQAAAAAVGVAALVWVMWWGRSESRGEIFLLNGRTFTQDELVAAEASFAKRGLNQYRIDSDRVRVPQHRQAEYLAAMAEADALPENLGELLVKAGAQNSPFSSSRQQSDSLNLAKQEMLGRIIGQMDGVQKAYVLFDSTESGGLRRERKLTASVPVESSNRKPLDRHRVLQIRHLVASAFAGLNPADVQVTDMHGAKFSAYDVHDAIGVGGEGAYLERMRAYQEFYRQALHDALAYVPGAAVSVNVELDKRTKDVIEEVRNQPASVSAMVREEIETERSEHLPLGAGSVAQNQGASLAPETVTANTHRDRRSRTEERTVSTQRTHVEQASMTPSKVTASVSVPHRYLEQVWAAAHQQQPERLAAGPTSAEWETLERVELEKIRLAAAQVLPFCDDPETARDRVAVTTFRQLREPVPSPPVAAPTPWRTIPLAGQVLVMCLLAAAALWLLRTSRSTPPAPRLAPSTASISSDDSPSDAVPSPDSEAAVQVLRGWLSEARSKAG